MLTFGNNFKHANRDGRQQPTHKLFINFLPNSVFRVRFLYDKLIFSLDLNIRKMTVRDKR